MDILFTQIQSDLRSNDALRQSSALLQALQQSVAIKDISVLSKSACHEILASPSSAVCKKLAFDLISRTLLYPDLSDTVCSALRTDLDFPNPDVSTAAVTAISTVPSQSLPSIVADAKWEITACFDSREIMTCLYPPPPTSASPPPRPSAVSSPVTTSFSSGRPASTSSTGSPGGGAGSPRTF